MEILSQKENILENSEKKKNEEFSLKKRIL